jgi:hypothetical protein
LQNEKILTQILENTNAVKKIICKKKETSEKVEEIEKEEKPKKEKTAKQRAEEKFKMVGTKLNQKDLKRFEQILEDNNTNASKYIRELIFDTSKGQESDIVEELEELRNKVKDYEEQWERFSNMSILRLLWEKLGIR